MKLPKQICKIASKVNPAAVVTELLDVVSSYLEYAKIREQEKTKREQFHQEVLTYIRMIEAEQEIFVRYFSREMALRNNLCNKLFKFLDYAEQTRDMENFCNSLDNILTILTSDPISNSNKNIRGANII